jgi:hypothetical protein
MRKEKASSRDEPLFGPRCHPSLDIVYPLHTMITLSIMRFFSEVVSFFNEKNIFIYYTKDFF